MLRTLKALVEEFDPEWVEVNGWVITFRDTSKVGARCSGKSSGENSNSVSRRLFLNRKKEKVDRLANEQREAERWTERFAEAGRSSNASSEWVPPSTNTELNLLLSRGLSNLCTSNSYTQKYVLGKNKQLFTAVSFSCM